MTAPERNVTVSGQGQSHKGLVHFTFIITGFQKRVWTTLFSEKAMGPHSSVLAWRIPGTGEPGGLQSMGSLRVGHD